MKRASLRMLMVILFILLLDIAISHANAVTLYAGSTAFMDIHVDHTIQIRDGGLVLINDTIAFSTKIGENTEPISSFSVGFPYKYRPDLDYCFAYEKSDPNAKLEVMADVGLGRIGFYGVNVIFPKPIDISDGKSYNFTVVFIFSNFIFPITESLFNFDFPMYPSLSEKASRCNVTVILPRDSNRTGSTHNFTETTKWFIYPPKIGMPHYHQILNHTQSPLEEFTNMPTSLEFQLGGEGIEKPIPFSLIECNEIKREITLDQWGSVHVFNFLDITNRGYDLSNFKVGFPEGALDLSVWDEFGSLEWLEENETVTMDLREPLRRNESRKFILSYRLSWERYIRQNGLSYNLNLTFYERFNWTIRRLVVSLTLPEGAEFKASNPLDPHDIEKNVFQETVTFTFFNVAPFQDLNCDLEFEYSTFWSSLRPTIWIGVLAMVICAVAFIWRVPRPPPAPIIPVPREVLRNFVDTYEGKTRILQEVESLEKELRKGRIPRRRYKVRKRMFEGRLSTLSRDLTGLREKIRMAGPKYADIMRKIEVAETTLEGLETTIRRVEARYRRGELSKGAYNKLMEEYRRRRERAKIMIDEVLLRLSEEIR